MNSSQEPPPNNASALHLLQQTLPAMDCASSSTTYESSPGSSTGSQTVSMQIQYLLSSHRDPEQSIKIVISLYSSLDDYKL